MEDLNITCLNSTQEKCQTKAETENGELDGYSLGVYGLGTDEFYNVHVPALTCICLSLVCAIMSIIYSFYRQHNVNFFAWTKSERFVVYMATCDGLFNISHFSDHFHIVITETLPRPKSLCVFYGFILEEFVTAQVLLVNLIAINVFVMIYFRKNVEFGKYDYRLLLYIFGVPALGGIIAVATDQFGPNGAFCYFDGVKGQTTNIFFTTVLLLSILVADVILYLISWFRIRKETNELKDSLGKSSQAIKLSHRAAKTMSLFVIAFFVQWWALALFGIWQVIDVIPPLLLNFVTTFSNIGGIVNGIVFILIIRRKKEDAEADRKDHEMSSGHRTQSTDQDA